MTTLTATYHLFAVRYRWNNEWSLMLSAASEHDNNEHTQYVYLKPLEISAELPPEDELLRSLVTGLRESQAKVMAEAQLAHTKIEETIQSLLSLPHHG